MRRDSEQILTEWLVLWAQSGDSRAMNHLAIKWRPKLIRYASRQIQDVEAAKDLVQETFITVCKSIGKLNDPAAFPRWIYQILHRRGVDYIRSRARIRRGNQAVNESCGKTSDEETLTSNIDIHNALHHLENSSYQLVHLHYLHGFNLKEIARVTGIPVGTVKSRLYAARHHLRQLMGDK